MMRPRSALSRYSRHSSATVRALRSAERRLGRVLSPKHVRESVAGLLPRLLRREHAVASDRQPPAAPVPVPVLHDERLRAARLDAEPEPGHLIVPQNTSRAGSGWAASTVRLVSFGIRVSTG